MVSRHSEICGAIFSVWLLSLPAAVTRAEQTGAVSQRAPLTRFLSESPCASLRGVELPSSTPLPAGTAQDTPVREALRKALVVSCPVTVVIAPLVARWFSDPLAVLIVYSISDPSWTCGSLRCPQLVESLHLEVISCLVHRHISK